MLLTGEPGIGKSRLTRALIESVAGEPHRRLRYFCSPHHTDSALHPVIAQIERAAGFERDDDAATRLDKLQAMLAYLATPRGRRRADRRPAVDRRRRCALAAARSGAAAAQAAHARRAPPQPSRRRPTRLPILAVFEDVHWIDPTSLELLDRMIVALQRLPVLLVVTARPGFEAPWARRRHATELALNRLRRTAAADLVRQIGGDLPDDMVREILDQTDGVPLFIEELTRAVVEGGRDASPAGHPDLAAGLADEPPRPPGSGEGAGAAQRRDRPPLLVGAARRHRRAQRGRGRGRARAADRRRAGLPGRVRPVSHLSLQACAGAERGVRKPAALGAPAAACAASPRPSKRAFPRRCPSRWPSIGRRQAKPARAAACWQKAGDQAIRRGANREAIALLPRASARSWAWPNRPERDRSEVTLQLALAEALIADRGWTAAETQPCWTRARELCERTGETAALFPILYGQFSTSLSRGEPDMHDLAQQALRLTAGGGDAGLSAVAHAMAGMSHFARGRFSVARVELEIALSLSSAANGPNTFLAADHNRAIASLWLAMTLLCSAIRRQAAPHAAAGLAAARGSTIRTRSPTRWRSTAATCRSSATSRHCIGRRKTSPCWPPSTASRSTQRPPTSISAGCWPSATSAADSADDARGHRGFRGPRRHRAPAVVPGPDGDPLLRHRRGPRTASICSTRLWRKSIGSGQRWCQAELQRFKAELQAGGLGPQFPRPCSLLKTAPAASRSRRPCR